jgi:presenilin-like A22 family membrane protease
MKHTFKVTLFLVAIFFVAQVFGLITINKYIYVGVNEQGETIIEAPDTVIGEQPRLTESEKSISYLPIMLIILFATAIIFVLIKFNLDRTWKFWFFLSVFITVWVALGVYIHKYIAVVFALIIAFLKLYKRNVIIHNLSEIFIYTGLAVLFLPFLNIKSGFGLLIIISIYDMIAVWQSKHMIKLANFQTRNKLFAGLFIPYQDKPLKEAKALKKAAKEAKKKKKEKKGKVKKVLVKTQMKTAILGGGDIAFPLLFSTSVMNYLILGKGMTKIGALIETLLLSMIVTYALFLLLIKARKDKFYPAMPFITMGCFIGFGVLLLINTFILMI